jgi:hypothetical protein
MELNDFVLKQQTAEGDEVDRTAFAVVREYVGGKLAIALRDYWNAGKDNDE